MRVIKELYYFSPKVRIFQGFGEKSRYSSPKFDFYSRFGAKYPVALRKI